MLKERITLSFSFYFPGTKTHQTPSTEIQLPKLLGPTGGDSLWAQRCRPLIRRRTERTGSSSLRRSVQLGASGVFGIWGLQLRAVPGFRIWALGVCVSEDPWFGLGFTCVGCGVGASPCLDPSPAFVLQGWSGSVSTFLGRRCHGFRAHQEVQ